MPKGPNGQKRPADANQLAKMIADLATGEAVEKDSNEGKDPAAVALGRKGGKSRASSMSPERRAEIAKNAAKKRWGQKMK